MTKLAKMGTRPTPGPLGTVTTTPDTFTREGAPAYTYDTKSQLFLLAVTNMVGEDTFYENAKARDDRYAGLVRAVATEDPEWLVSFVGWLRQTANMRTASIVAAVEGGDALAGTPHPRRLLGAALQRADEPADALGYWFATRGRRLPSWLKRGLADAALHYTEYSTLKYDTQGSPIRFADVIELADSRHLDLDEHTQALWGHLIDRRHGHADETPEALPMLRARQSLERVPASARSLVTAQQLTDAGMTWEAFATYLGGPWTAAAWEKVIPSMGYMALLRNLRNFDQAGISATVVQSVIARLVNPAEVAKSKQLPMRFLSAYNAVTNDRWKFPLGEALQASLANVPRLDGPTAVLIDTSGSMAAGFSKDGTLARWDAAALFGIAFAIANGLESVQSFSNDATYMSTPPGSSVLNLLARFRREHFHNGGTNTALALQSARQVWPGAVRALVLTDEQASAQGDVVTALDRFARSFTFNLAGYKESMAPRGGSHYTIGGLSDQAFTMMSLLEKGTTNAWPWPEAHA